MQFSIQSHNIEITDHLHSFTEKRISETFSNFDKSVKKINVRLFLLNSNSKTSKVACQLEVHTRCLPTIYTESRANDVYKAVNSSVKFARKSVSRKLTKFEALLKKIKFLNKQKARASTLKLPYRQQQLTREFA